MSGTRLRSSLRPQAPGWKLERSLWEAGSKIVGGIDEVGKGSWAGPLTVAIVIPPRTKRIYKVRDSKLLTEPERETLMDRILGWCADWAVGHAGPDECDSLGMSAAQRLASSRAMAELRLRPDRLVVDGRWDFVGGGIGVPMVGGDRLSVSVAAASVVAKVTRDRIMRLEAEHFPAYNFASNKGYPCPVHKASLHAWGPSTIHRRTWKFMDRLMWPGVRRTRQGSLF